MSVLKKGKKREFEEVAQDLIKKTQAEDGCLSYDLYEDINDENVVAMLEEWRDQESIDAHFQTEHLKSAAAKFNELRDSSQIRFFRKL